MERIRLAELRKLTATRQDHCVSIFLPTHLRGKEAAQDALRIKNLADRAEAELVERGMRAAEARDMLRPVRSLPSDPAQWQQRTEGVAIFATPGELHVFGLPVAVQEYVAVNRRFHIKPLLPVVLEDQQFYVLAFSKKSPRLILASRDSATEVDVPGMPERIELALNYQTAGRGAQVHTPARGAEAVNRQSGTVFHAQSGAPEASKEELTHYLRMVAEAVEAVVAGTRLPVVVHAVEYVMPRLKEVWDYPHLIGEPISGSPEYLRPDQLRDRAWPVASSYLEQSRERAIGRFRQLFGTGKATDNILEIAPAVREGKVDSLLVDTKGTLWGNFDPQSMRAELHADPRPGDDDLVDWVAGETLAHRGAVYAVPTEQMPSDSAVAAIFRY